MTRPELHELVDIVMDARERTGEDLRIVVRSDYVGVFGLFRSIFSPNYPTFSDFTQAVKEYIKRFG